MRPIDTRKFQHVADSCSGLSIMKKQGNKVLEEEEVLCCCEYMNREGQRSHIAACCCDCEDLDEACERWLSRKQQRPDSLSKLTEVVSDRIRVPWLWGGARKLDLSVIPPLVLLPVLLHLAALHFLLGMVVLTALPGLVLWYYYFTHRKKGRTLFFLSLALFSLAYMYYLFITEVLPRGDVSPAQLTVVTVGVALTLAALAHTKKEPGIVRPQQEDVHSTVTYFGPLPDRDPAVNGGKREVVTTVANRGASSEQAGLEHKGSGQWNWCPVCRVVRPPRAGHCRICGVCVLRLDHHCVWWVPLKPYVPLSWLVIIFSVCTSLPHCHFVSHLRYLSKGILFTIHLCSRHSNFMQ